MAKSRKQRQDKRRECILETETSYVVSLHLSQLGDGKMELPDTLGECDLQMRYRDGILTILLPKKRPPDLVFSDEETVKLTPHGFFALSA